jgi:hypothetical protein
LAQSGKGFKWHARKHLFCPAQNTVAHGPALALVCSQQLASKAIDAPGKPSTADNIFVQRTKMLAKYFCALQHQDQRDD